MPAGYLGEDRLGSLILGEAYRSMTPTTLRAVAYATANAIRQITPSYPLHQDDGWHAIDVAEDVGGARRRTFHCQWDPPVPVREDTIHGSDAGKYDCSLRVYVSYNGLSEQDDSVQDVHAEMPTADGQDLISTLDALVDPVTDGLIAYFQQGFNWEVVTPGSAWGAHLFTVRMLLSY